MASAPDAEPRPRRTAWLSPGLGLLALAAVGIGIQRLVDGELVGLLGLALGAVLIVQAYRAEERADPVDVVFQTLAVLLVCGLLGGILLDSDPFAAGGMVGLAVLGAGWGVSERLRRPESPSQPE